MGGLFRCTPALCGWSYFGRRRFELGGGGGGDNFPSFLSRPLLNSWGCAREDRTVLRSSEWPGVPCGEFGVTHTPHAFLFGLKVSGTARLLPDSTNGRRYAKFFLVSPSLPLPLPFSLSFSLSLPLSCLSVCLPVYISISLSPPPLSHTLCSSNNFT